MQKWALVGVVCFILGGGISRGYTTSSTDGDAVKPDLNLRLTTIATYVGEL